MHAQLRAYSKFHIRLTYFYCISKQDDLKWFFTTVFIWPLLASAFRKTANKSVEPNQAQAYRYFFLFCMLTPASVKALATFSKKKNLE